MRLLEHYLLAPPLAGQGDINNSIFVMTKHNGKLCLSRNYNPKKFILLFTEYEAVGETVFAQELPAVISSCCDSTTHCITYPYNFPNLYEVSCCNYDPGCIATITDVTSGDAAYCNSYLTTYIWGVVRSYCNTRTIPSTCPTLPSALQVLQVLVL